MTSHSSSPSLSSEHTFLPNQPFFSWLRGQTTLFISQILAILSFISLLVSLIYYAVHVMGDDSEIVTVKNIQIFIDYAHILFVVIFIIALIRILDDNVRGSYRVGLAYKRVFRPELLKQRETESPQLVSEHNPLLNESKYQLRQFKRYFLFFWCSMLFLYVSFAFKHNLEREAIHSVSTEAGKISIEIGSLKLQIQSDQAHKPGRSYSRLDDQTPYSYPQLFRALLFPFLTFAWNNVSLLCLFFCFLVLSSDKRSPKKHKYFAWASGVLMGLLTAAFPLFVLLSKVFGTVTEASFRNQSAAFDALSGTINGVVLAVLIARLDSKLIGLPSWLVCVMYFYSAVQPLFVLFEQQDTASQTIQASVLLIVFIFKIYFFLIIVYTLQTGRMLNYLVSFPLLNKRANSVFDGRSMLPKEGFFLWLKGRIIFFVMGVIGFVISIALVSLAVSHDLYPTNSPFSLEVIERFIEYAHVLLLVPIVCIAMIWVLGGERRPVRYRKVAYSLRKKLDSDRPRPRMFRGRRIHRKIFEEGLDRRHYLPLLETSRHQLRLFKRYFLFFWCAMLALYVSFALQQSLGLTSPNRPASASSRSSGDVSGTTEHLAAKDEDQSPGNEHRAFPDIKQVEETVFKVINLGLNNLGLLFAFWCFVILYLPKGPDERCKLLRNYSTLLALLVTVAFPLLVFSGEFSQENLENYSRLCFALSGTLNSVVLALLIARLDSKLIGLRSRLIFVLYFYPAIQPFFALFDQSVSVFHSILIYVLIMAFTLKLYFFLIVAYIFETGRMRNYLFCFPVLSARVDSVFDNQFEIKVRREHEHSFNFSITNKSVLVYFTDSNYNRREDCDLIIRELRKLMEDEDNYVPMESSGTYWLEVKDAAKDVVCQSISLRSEDEASDLKRESIEKIPYCKYDRG